MKIENRQQLLALVAGLAVALWVGDRLVLTPLTRGWKERSARITELRRSIEQGALLLDRERAINERWTSMKTNTLPNDVSAAENTVLQAFDRWSRESRVSISSIKPLWKSGDDGASTVEFRADASGSLQAVSRFLYEIEKDPLALRIESVQLSARDNNGQELALGLQLSGLVLNRERP